MRYILPDEVTSNIMSLSMYSLKPELLEVSINVRETGKNRGLAVGEARRE
jgi:hypothetical protein